MSSMSMTSILMLLVTVAVPVILIICSSVIMSANKGQSTTAMKNAYNSGIVVLLVGIVYLLYAAWMLWEKFGAHKSSAFYYF